MSMVTFVAPVPGGLVERMLSIPRVTVLAIFVTNSHVVMAEGVTVNQSIDQYSVTSEIHGDSLSQVHGALSVNQAAGDSNAQSNSRAIAVTQDGGVAIAYTIDGQSVDMSQAVMPDVAVSRISDRAFNGTSGLISINQASGVSNIQLNAFAIAMSINAELSDSTLADTHSDAPVIAPDNALPVNTTREAHIDDTSFVGASGIVQLNQISGTGNVTSNRFEMSMGQAN